MQTEEDLKIWNMVHDWCNGIHQDIQVAYIPDMAKRHLMDLIESSAKEVAEAQRKACCKSYKTAQAENIAEKIKEANSANYEGKFHDLRKAVYKTPLVTDDDL